MNVLDLFSGIGGFSLGLERAGMRTVAFCEIEPYARRVLEKHWPGIPCYPDVRELSANRLSSDGIRPDVICGGFPCQDISLAGAGAGIAGERSGLWFEYARLIGELRPQFVIVENVTALLGRGLDRVLGSLASIGYDAEWHCIPASAIGAKHQRDRIWVVAYPHASERRPVSGSCYGLEKPQDGLPQGQEGPSGSGASSQALAYADSGNAQGVFTKRDDPQNWRKPLIGPARLRDGTGHYFQWPPEPDVGRVAHGISGRVDRLKGLGNAVVPQIPEIIGRAIMTHVSMTRAERECS